MWSKIVHNCALQINIYLFTYLFISLIVFSLVLFSSVSVFTLKPFTFPACFPLLSNLWPEHSTRNPYDCLQVHRSILPHYHLCSDPQSFLSARFQCILRHLYHNNTRYIVLVILRLYLVWHGFLLNYL